MQSEKPKTSLTGGQCRFALYRVFEGKKHSRAKVSSILTISLALVSMNPQPLLLAYSNPCLLLITLPSFRSHLFPATSLTGCTPPVSYEAATISVRDLTNRRLTYGSVIAFHIYHLHEVIKIVEGGGSRDVVDEKEGVGFEIRGGPEAAVFLLAGRVGEGEEVGLSVYSSGGGVGVL